MRLRLFAAAALILIFPNPLHAGGPAWVAGAGYNSGVEGQPILWTNATVQYFTDQGPLSPILTNAQADAFVANAIAPWTSVPNATLTVAQAGHLAEDVNGSNIQGQFGVISAPADITPQATSTPLGIVYDYDGSVTDALLGQGAGSLSDCFTNAVYGGPDNFSASGNIVHAVAIINGVCAATTTQLPDVQYRLVRVLGRIFGLAWSQANDNVFTHNPYPGNADYQGFPVMHFEDPVNCVPISICYGGIFEGALGNNATTPALDDATAIARLYPATNPQSTGRIWGNVYFTNSTGQAAQPMQGVNVVARLMVSGSPSRQYVATSISGFSFVGNAGNIVTGYDDATGLPFNRFGSSDPTVEGLYDLGQLPIPNGQQIAQYQITVEPIDPTWSWGVEPYGPTQVAPSGTFAPIVVTIQNGSNVEDDILMQASEIAQPAPGANSTYTNPVPLPQGGGWAAWISGYGASQFFMFNVQANRTASFAATALNENGAPTELKLQPIIGIWELGDDTGNPAPASTPSAFNSLTFGETRLDAQFNSTEAYKVGIVDYRGDGRPDYAYEASILYSDTITPARLSLAGGFATLQGLGFRPGLAVDNGTTTGTVLTQSATQLQISLPSANIDGPATIEVTDPATGSFSQMQSALTYGAAQTDLLQLIQGTSQTAPIGAQAPSQIRVRAVASDNATPVSGATIAWSATNSVQLSACNGATSCSVLTDAAGESSTWATPTQLGTATITSALAPAAYQPPQTTKATLIATASTQDLAAINPTRWLAQGVTLSIPLTVEALNMGVPQSGVGIKFTPTLGSAQLSPTTTTTNSNGQATTTATVTNINTTVQISACETPQNNPCQTFTLFAVAPTSWVLEGVSGTQQIVPDGQPFQPLVMRVTDGSSFDNPVQGATVQFQTTLERNPQGGGGPPLGNAMQQGGAGQGAPQGSGQKAQDGQPIILGTSTAQVATDQNGLASITPSAAGLGPCDLFMVITAGAATAQFELEDVDALPSTEQPKPIPKPVSHSPGYIPFPAWSMLAPESPSVQLFAVPQEIPEIEAPATEPKAEDANAVVAPPPSPPPVTACSNGDPSSESKGPIDAPEGRRSCVDDSPDKGDKPTPDIPPPGLLEGKGPDLPNYLKGR
ncbi:MAG TPA: Ig-like domain-containing protein [Terriglobales bacterium]|nr:Ig-like domain-containing protein [Terriglobales bacterium]